MVIAFIVYVCTSYKPAGQQLIEREETRTTYTTERYVHYTYSHFIGIRSCILVRELRLLSERRSHYIALDWVHSIASVHILVYLDVLLLCMNVFECALPCITIWECTKKQGYLSRYIVWMLERERETYARAPVELENIVFLLYLGPTLNGKAVAIQSINNQDPIR